MSGITDSMKRAFTSATAEDEEGDQQSFSSEVREQRVRAGGHG